MYSPDMMDCESDIQSLNSIQSPSNISAQSPATMAAQIDTSFVSKHNITAEAYQVCSLYRVLNWDYCSFFANIKILFKFV